MVNALRIALFEDDASLVADMSTLLRRRGYEVVLICESMTQVYEALGVDRSGKLINGITFDVAVVDGNLGQGLTGQDGAEICHRLQFISPLPHIIGNSGAGPVQGAHVQAYKDITLLQSLLKDVAAQKNPPLE